MSFANPIALLLLLLIPVFVVVGYPRSRYRRLRSWLSLGLRIVLILLIVLALAGFQLPRQSDQLAVVFVVDASDSMSPRTQAEALDYVRTAMAELQPDRDQAAVIFFGANAVVEHPMANTLELGQRGATPITLQTDLDEALRLALALFPPEAAKRIVILSDGVETVGNGEQAAELAAAAGVQIDYVPFAREVLSDEILVSDVQVPGQVNEDELFDLSVNVQSASQTTAELRVLGDGEIIYQETVALEAGDNRFIVGPLSLPSSDFLDFRVQVEPIGADGFFQNNELSAFTEVEGRPNVLLVTPDESETLYLQAALEENGLVVETITPRNLPTSLAELRRYSSILLVNAPATQMNQERMELLQTYTRDLGGGLIAIGGPQSFGVGGYYQTPLEETLPVEMRIRDEQRIPTMTMLFILDRSGSMEMVSNAQGVSNLELGKEAILRSFDFLNDYDRTGVISFDSSAYFIIETREVGDEAERQGLKNQVAELRPGGGTDIYGALVAASQVLPEDPSAVKHMILLSDGGSDPVSSLELADRMYTDYGITVSVVAIGQGYAPWVRDLARAGRGNFHEVFDPSTIPAIFASEAVIASRSYIFEQEFTPTLTARSPIVDGINTSPTLLGYVATTEKDTATVILRGPEDDPLLASWQYGLGRAVAFTSDATARWGVNWVTWEDYSRFWSQVVRWTITEGSDNNLEVRVEQRGEQAYLVLEARDDEGQFLNGVGMEARVVSPDLETETLVVPQIAPGQYEIPFSPATEGAYYISVAGAGQTAQSGVSQSTGWVLSYSAEYALRESDTQKLGRLAEITGGESLADQPARVFEHNLDLATSPQSIWQWLLMAAALLLFFDVAARRIVITQSDIQSVREAISDRLNAGRLRRTASSGRMGNLMEAKRRTTAATQSDLDDIPPPPPARPERPAPSPTPAPSKESPTPTRATRPAGPLPERGSSVSKLLEKKRGDKE
jgi:uncharacterized membrane protein